MSPSFLIQVASSLVVAAAVTASQPALADTPVGSVTVSKIIVYYGDLNLADDRGAGSLLHRIMSAARQACGDATGEKAQLHDLARARQCRAASVQEAITLVNHPIVAAAYEGRIIKRSRLAGR